MREEQTRRAYSFYAPFYDALFGYVFRRGRESTISRLEPRPRERILEVGVGTGLMLPLYPGHCDVVGVDLSEAMLERARQRVAERGLSSVVLRKMDAGRLAFPDGSFDAVVAAYVITAVPDHRAVLDEMIRVCRPGGRIVLTNHFSNGDRILGLLERAVSSMFEYAGFRTDLTLGDVIDGCELSIRHVEPIGPFGLWRVVVCTKPPHAHAA